MMSLDDAMLVEVVGGGRRNCNNNQNNCGSSIPTIPCKKPVSVKTLHAVSGVLCALTDYAKAFKKLDCSDAGLFTASLVIALG